MQANFISWALSVLNAFYWNNRFVFKNSQSWKKALLKTYASYGLSLLVSTALLYVQVELIGVSEKVAPLITLLITVPMNFLMNKFWTFR